MVAQKIRKKQLLLQMHIFLDLCLTIAAFTATYFFRKFLLPSYYPEYYGALDIDINYYFILLLISSIWFLNFYFFDLYTNFTEKKITTIVFDVLKASTVSMFILIASLYIFKIVAVSRTLLGIFFVVDVGLLILSKYIIITISREYWQSEQNRSNILIVGSKSRAISVIENIFKSNRFINVIGCVEVDKEDVGKVVTNGVKVIGVMSDLKRLLLNHVVDEVVFAMPLKRIDSVDVYMLLIEMLGKRIRIIPDWHIHSLLYQPGIASIAFDDFNGSPTMVLSTTTSKHRDLLLKFSFDYMFAFIALFLLSPIFLFVASCIKLASSNGTVFYKQKRLGLNGRVFDIYKFRTMVPDADKKLQELMARNEADGPAFKIKNDPRVIPFIGTLLRKTSLDELPQLINVLKGEMSLVGPRPPIPSEVAQYDIWQRRRLSMKPGLTCIWQIQPNRNDISFNNWMEMDLNYIDNWSLKLDFFILWKTALVVFGAQGR